MSAPKIKHNPNAPKAVYLRLSVNKDGKKESVPTQRKFATRLVEATWPGATVVEFVDDGITASDPNVIRPGFAALLDAIRRGQVSAVVAAEQSRITRQTDGEQGWEQFRTVCELAGISELHTWREGVIGLAAGQGTVGSIMAVVRKEESAITKLRLNDALADRAEQGRPAGGCSFGYRNTRDAEGRAAIEPDPETAPELLAMAHRVLAGDSLMAIAQDLTARGVPTRRGGKWAYTTVRQAVLAPTATGLRVYRGEVVGEGTWEAIIPRDMHTALKLELDRSRVRVIQRSDGTTWRPGRRRPNRRYLLTGGLARCGKCGAALVAATVRGGSVYQCAKARGGCNRLSISCAEEMEAFVLDAVREHVTSDKFRAEIVAGDDQADERERLLDEARAIEARRTESSMGYAQGVIDLAQLGQVRELLDAEAARVAEAQAALRPPADAVDPELLAHGWNDLTITEQRTVLEAFVSAVVIGPAIPGSRGFVSSRVDVRFIERAAVVERAQAA